MHALIRAHLSIHTDMMHLNDVLYILQLYPIYTLHASIFE